MSAYNLSRVFDVCSCFVQFLIKLFPLSDLANDCFVEILLEIRSVKLRVETMRSPGLSFACVFRVFLYLLQVIGIVDRVISHVDFDGL